MNFALIGQAVSEKMVENNGHIQVYSRVEGTDNHLGHFFFKNKHLWSFAQVAPGLVTL